MVAPVRAVVKLLSLRQWLKNGEGFLASAFLHIPPAYLNAGNNVVTPCIVPASLARVMLHRPGYTLRRTQREIRHLLFYQLQESVRDRGKTRHFSPTAAAGSGGLGIRRIGYAVPHPGQVAVVSSPPTGITALHPGHSSSPVSPTPAVT